SPPAPFVPVPIN
nr:RecName: Full=26 kDa cell wall protein [Nicotiana tabacum]